MHNERNHPGISASELQKEWDRNAAIYNQFCSANNDSQKWDALKQLLDQNGVNITQDVLRQKYQEYMKQMRESEIRQKVEAQREIEKKQATPSAANRGIER